MGLGKRSWSSMNFDITGVRRKDSGKVSTHVVQRNGSLPSFLENLTSKLKKIRQRTTLSKTRFDGVRQGFYTLRRFILRRRRIEFSCILKTKTKEIVRCLSLM